MSSLCTGDNFSSLFKSEILDRCHGAPAQTGSNSAILVFLSLFLASLKSSATSSSVTACSSFKLFRTQRLRKSGCSQQCQFSCFFLFWHKCTLGTMCVQAVTSKSGLFFPPPAISGTRLWENKCWKSFPGWKTAAFLDQGNPRIAIETRLFLFSPSFWQLLHGDVGAVLGRSTRLLSAFNSKPLPFLNATVLLFLKASVMTSLLPLLVTVSSGGIKF